MDKSAGNHHLCDYLVLTQLLRIEFLVIAVADYGLFVLGTILHDLDNMVYQFSDRICECSPFPQSDRIEICTASFLIGVHVPGSSENHLGNHTDVLGILSDRDRIIVRLVLASCKILHSIDCNVFECVDAFVRFHYRSHRLPGKDLKLVSNGPGCASEVFGECPLAESVAIVEQQVLKVNIDPLCIIIEMENSFGERFSTSFTQVPLHISVCSGKIKPS